MTVISIKDLRIKNLHRIVIGQINKDPIRNKFYMLWQYCQNNLGILLISETKLDSSFYISGYGYTSPYRLDRNKFGRSFLL